MKAGPASGSTKTDAAEVDATGAAEEAAVSEGRMKRPMEHSGTVVAGVVEEAWDREDMATVQPMLDTAEEGRAVSVDVVRVGEAAVGEGNDSWADRVEEAGDSVHSDADRVSLV